MKINENKNLIKIKFEKTFKDKKWKIVENYKNLMKRFKSQKKILEKNQKFFNNSKKHKK